MILNVLDDDLDVFTSGVATQIAPVPTSVEQHTLKLEPLLLFLPYFLASGVPLRVASSGPCSLFPLF